MAGAKVAPEVLAHLEWLGFVQPTGLVVSAPALVRAGAVLDRRDVEGQLLLAGCIAERTVDSQAGSEPYLPDFESFARTVLGWSFSPKFYAGTEGTPPPAELEVALPEFDETLLPDFAVQEPDPTESGSRWQLLVGVLETGEGFDTVRRRGAGKLEASAHGRMERLLRQTGVLAGLLVNGTSLRLISAPRGESSGWLDIRVADMLATAGRPICTAMRLLLSERRLLTLPRAERLTALLDDSRRYQNEVSERLAEQVLHALYELLRGFQAANDASAGELLRTQLREHPDGVYHALLTVLLRLVFLLYAEERGMLSDDEAFVRYYSLAGLHERLREDAALYTDTMDQRFGAWAQLLTLFRIVHDGATAGDLHLPERHGVLFDPDRFPFLEGRPSAGARQIHERIDAPLVPDGTIYRALEKLLVLDGERISYRALDVEQIGSVYETMMGFRLETATGRSVAIKASRKRGAPTAVDLEALLAEFPTKRDKLLSDQADLKPTDRLKRAVEEAATLEDLHAALLPVIDLAASPDLVPAGAMMLQPNEERRRSGSHYTPRALTEPIVRTTLAPIIARLRGPDGRPPKPERILELKVCDPAMGSGAFLVEACRQLADALVEAWHAYAEAPGIPPDEDEVIFARRLIAQRCLYGVDKNPIAADLAKVALWLVTLAKDHALTFMDHALRDGDSLVGLSRNQIEAFHWDPDAVRFQAGFEALRVGDHLAKVAELRRRIREADETLSDRELRELWDDAQFQLGQVRLFGDLIVAAFFEGSQPIEREEKRTEYASALVGGDTARYRAWLDELGHADPRLAPFHWEIEFPEVFVGENPGFDAFVGNPPFLGGTRISILFGLPYLDWVATQYLAASRITDLCAYFFRRAYSLTRRGGCLGLVATNTISQGDTRRTGLEAICEDGGWIYEAVPRFVWPGAAAVVVSLVHIAKNADPACTLNGRPVDFISAFLFHRGGHSEPRQLVSNHGISLVGSYVLGIGFVFDDGNPSASPLSLMRQLTESNPTNASRIRPYLGGEEFNRSPTHSPSRFIIDFEEMTEAEARRWPDLFHVVEEKVRPARMRVKQRDRREIWWWHATRSPELRSYLADHERFLVLSQTSTHLAVSFLPRGITVSHALVAFLLDADAALAVLQGRAHEAWARFFGSTMKDDLRYTPSDCFETFPMPEGWETDLALEAAGRDYYHFRSSLMVRNDEGLTKTYNRFHDPDERDAGIIQLRELHSVMDRAVLDAYGWSDLPTECEFLLDYEVAEEESSRKKKPWRFRWPDAVRDDVLARLLELNTQRAAQESRAGAGATPARVARERAAPGPGSERLL